jgi:hypothetical protein
MVAAVVEGDAGLEVGQQAIPESGAERRKTLCSAERASGGQGEGRCEGLGGAIEREAEDAAEERGGDVVADGGVVGVGVGGVGEGIDEEVAGEEGLVGALGAGVLAGAGAERAGSEGRVVEGRAGGSGAFDAREVGLRGARCCGDEGDGGVAAYQWAAMAATGDVGGGGGVVQRLPGWEGRGWRGRRDAVGDLGGKDGLDPARGAGKGRRGCL